MALRNKLLTLFVLGLSLAQTWAQVAPQEVPSVSASPKVKLKKSKGRVPREKDAEGTQAPHSFDQSDTIIKSKYEYKGQPLEVDTE